MKSEKGVSGKVLTTIGSLLMAFLALVLLWTFLTGTIPLISEVVENSIGGFKTMLCETFGRAGGMCKWLIGE